MKEGIFKKHVFISYVYTVLVNQVQLHCLKFLRLAFSNKQLIKLEGK